jgi:hypothetical protein
MAREGSVVLLLFHLPEKSPPRVATQLSQRLYGRTVSTWSGKYHYPRPGLLTQIPHRRVGRGALVLWKRDVGKVVTLLGQVGAAAEVREVKPLAEDLRELRRPLR